MIKRRGTGFATLMCALCIAAVGAGLLFYSADVAQGIRDGLRICGNVLIPSLFPFMVLAGYLSRTDYARILSVPLATVTTKVLKLPAGYGALVLLSLVGGYPVGARMVANLLAERKIDSDTAKRMLCFCVNCGPSFMVSAVGAGMLLDKRAGVILLVTQALSTLLVGAGVSRKASAPPPSKSGKPPQRGTAVFVSAVSGAASSMLIMCAFAVLFSGVLALLRTGGVISHLAGVLRAEEDVVLALCSGLLEVTAGCLAGAEIGGAAGFGLISMCVSFGGLSVIFQIMSCFEGMAMDFRPFLLSRLAHGICAAAMALPLYHIFCAGEQDVWAAIHPPVMYSDDKTWILSGCLLAMCTILALSSGKDSQ